MTEESRTVWGDKAIQDELARILEFRPSISWGRRWSEDGRANRLPVKRLHGSYAGSLASSVEGAPGGTEKL
jgi:hypothetical protein